MVVLLFITMYVCLVKPHSLYQMIYGSEKQSGSTVGPDHTSIEITRVIIKVGKKISFFYSRVFVWLGSRKAWLLLNYILSVEIDT